MKETRDWSLKDKLEILAIAGKLPKEKPIKKIRRSCGFKVLLPKPNFDFFQFEEILLPANITQFAIYQNGIFGQPSALNITKHVSSVEKDFGKGEITATLVDRKVPQSLNIDSYIHYLRLLGNKETARLSELLEMLSHQEAWVKSRKTKEEIAFMENQMSQKFNSKTMPFQFIRPEHYMRVTYMSDPFLEGEAIQPSMSIRKVSFSAGLVQLLDFSIDEFKFKVLREGLPSIYADVNIESVSKTIEARVGGDSYSVPMAVLLDGRKNVRHCDLTISTNFQKNEYNQRILELTYSYKVNSSTLKKNAHQQLSKKWSPSLMTNFVPSPVSSPLTSISMPETLSPSQMDIEVQDQSRTLSVDLLIEEQKKEDFLSGEEKFLLKFYPTQFPLWKKYQESSKNQGSPN